MDTSSLVEQLQLNQITSLTIYNKQLIKLGGIEGLVNLLRHNSSSVTRLDLSGLHIGDEGAKRIAQLLQHYYTLSSTAMVLEMKEAKL
jgi:Ran GTPase-activating protein (RanGAP) involved in mRNA processing and transport